MSIFINLIDVFYVCVDVVKLWRADVYRKWRFLYRCGLMCIKNRVFCSQRAAEGLVQQRLFQLVQGGQLLLVDGFEALDFLP